MSNEAIIVARDALIEGRGTEAEQIAADERERLLARIYQLCDNLGFAHARKWPTNPRQSYLVESIGKRFAKVIMSDGTQRSVWGFVEMSNGLVWKAASWKAPTLNYPRGCMHDDASVAVLATRIHGVHGLPAYHKELA